MWELPTRRAVTAPAGPAQGEWQGTGAWDQAGDRGRARREEGGEGAGSRKGRRSKSYSGEPVLCLTVHPGPSPVPPWKGYGGHRPGRAPRLPYTSHSPKPGKPSPQMSPIHPSVPRPSCGLSALPRVPPLRCHPTCSFLLSPSHHALPSKYTSGPRVVSNRSFWKAQLNRFFIPILQTLPHVLQLVGHGPHPPGPGAQLAIRSSVLSQGPLPSRAV